MKKAALIVLQLGLAVLVGLGVRELWLASTGEDGAGDRAPETISVASRVTPDVHTFGEPVRATVEVVADAGFIKPETVRVETDFAPYALAGEPVVERTVVHGVARVVFQYPLRCLREGCDAAAARGVAQFEPGFVHYRYVEGSGPGRHILDWPPVEVASRVTAADLEALRWRASETALPPLTMRVGPIGFAGALLAIALALVATAVLLGRRLWQSEEGEDEEQDYEARTPLERALELVVADTRNGSSAEDRRRTLERLARELTAVGHGRLAEDARELAWSPGSASSDEVSGLARRVADATGTQVT